MNALFHLAFPVYDLARAKIFYVDQLGCYLGRESEHALILGLGIHQIVAHKVADLPEEQAGIYPRHFGLVFLDRKEFDHFIARLDAHNIVYEHHLRVRFAGTLIEHHSFFLKDPSNNLLEFKYYAHQEAILGAQQIKNIGDSESTM